MASNLFQHFPPRNGRTHEVFGQATYSFALTVAAYLSGAVLWVKEGWQENQINPIGVQDYFSPNRLLLAHGKDQKEVLAVGEEALRSGSTPLVVMELTKPLSMLAGRRLQLAAETGQATGLCLIQESMGSNTTETRWCCKPIFDENDSTLEKWELKKNKSGTLGSWNISRHAEATLQTPKQAPKQTSEQAYRIAVVPEVT